MGDVDISKHLTLIVLISWAVLIFAYDIFSRKIPNYLSFGGIFIGVLMLTVTGKSLMSASLSSSLVGVLVAILLTLPGYMLKQLGGGDVKLLIAVALLCGLEVMLYSFSLASMSVLVVYIIVPRLLHYFGWLCCTGKVRPKRFMPLGAAIMVGMTFTVSYQYFFMGIVIN